MRLCGCRVGRPSDSLLGGWVFGRTHASNLHVVSWAESNVAGEVRNGFLVLALAGSVSNETRGKSVVGPVFGADMHGVGVPVVKRAAGLEVVGLSDHSFPSILVSDSPAHLSLSLSP